MGVLKKINLRRLYEAVIIGLALFALNSEAFGQVCGQYPILKIRYSDGCDNSPAAYTKTLPTNCTVTQVFNDCIRTVWNRCCDDSIQVYEDSVSDSETITGVAIGSEREAALAAMEAFKSTHPFPSAQPGYVRVDMLEGSAYSSRMNDNGTSALVDFVAWRRANFVKMDNGTVVPLESLTGGTGGSGSGGGLSKSDTTQAFKDALGGDNLTAVANAVAAGFGSKLGASDIKQAFKDALDNGSFKGGISKQEAQDAFDAAMGKYFGDNRSYSLGSSFNEGTYTKPERYSKTLSTVWSDFKTNISGTALFSVPSQFFGGLTVNNPSSVISFSAGRFGNFSYDFASMSSTWLILKSSLLICFAYASVKIIVLKGA
ncbi:MAG: hypothetical protein HQL10_13465 [Nitrospirae bacterium]|nr:hypothetical protein [Nitrospirota bacterium]